MPLHLTKVAFGATSIDQLIGWFENRPAPARLTTRYMPKRHAEIIGGGSLFWILKHKLVARSPILEFAPAEGGKTDIVCDTRLILVRPLPKRAHQGWRYLEGADAPRDLASGDGADALPAEMVGELSALGLI
jgi:hypothetical protein